MNHNNVEYEYRGLALNGFFMLFLSVLAIPAFAAWLFITDHIITGIILLFVAALCWSGFFVQQPNQSRVLIFFGKYRGSFRKAGFYWINPFMAVKKVSLRIRNMDIEPIKVNDKVGNPVMIGMVLVWKVCDTYKVVFDLDSKSVPGTGTLNNNALDEFVRIQGDAALREVTGQFAYDSESVHNNSEVTLRDGGEVINELLERKINERLAMAGIQVVEARLNYLAYAPEIAAVMLRRQQAAAIISAREKIVDGAVTMVEMALERIEKSGFVTLDNERKAAMVGNLLVVLCADEPASPVLNTSQH